MIKLGDLIFGYSHPQITLFGNEGQQRTIAEFVPFISAILGQSKPYLNFDGIHDYPQDWWKVI